MLSNLPVFEVWRSLLPLWRGGCDEIERTEKTEQEKRADTVSPFCHSTSHQMTSQDPISLKTALISHSKEIFTKFKFVNWQCSERVSAPILSFAFTLHFKMGDAFNLRKQLAFYGAYHSHPLYAPKHLM